MFFSQVWYVWFTTNWLQILFLLTLVLLLVSSCVTFQVTTFFSAKYHPKWKSEEPKGPDF